MSRTAALLVLASTSSYRADLLRRLGLPFSQRAPEVDEAGQPGEEPAARALRLSIAKAEAVATAFKHALVIGSDQVATCDGRILHKPGTVANAQAQLQASSGHAVTFHTAVCLLDTRSQQRHTYVDVTTAHLRQLDANTIRRYVQRERPLDCAGSFKCEGLGIALFEHIDSTDPTALIGLPLIAVARLLRECGIELP